MYLLYDKDDVCIETLFGEDADYQYMVDIYKSVKKNKKEGRRLNDYLH
jgi:hypothetical protein